MRKGAEPGEVAGGFCEDGHWEGIFTDHNLEHPDYRQMAACLGECCRRPD